MIIAANFKCNHTRKGFAKYAQKLNAYLSFNNFSNLEIIIAPSATSYLDSEFNFIQAAQNIYPDFNGAYTGEVGLSHLQEFGIKTVIIGHSERRELGESDEFLAAKFEFCKENDLRMIYCIGEDYQTYENKKSLEFLERQISKIDLNYKNLILAYEPIYSIGKSAAKLEDIARVIEFLKSRTKQCVLYGGSVNAGNIGDIKKLCNGVLVGGASLNVDGFIELINAGVRA